MKMIMESWDKYLSEASIETNQTPAPQSEAQSFGQMAAAGIGQVSSVIATKFGEMDAYMQKNYCEKKFPLHLKGQGDIQTWGDLVALMRCGIEYSDRKKVLATVAGFIPKIGPALSYLAAAGTASQFIMQSYQVADDERPEGNLGKLDMDDHVAAIIDNKVEKEFLKFMVKELTDTKNLEKDIDPNWDVTTALQAFLKDKAEDRTITGFEQGE